MSAHGTLQALGKDGTKQHHQGSQPSHLSSAPNVIQRNDFHAPLRSSPVPVRSLDGSQSSAHTGDNPASSQLNAQDEVDFPSLSTAVQFSTLPKRKRMERGAFNSLSLSEPHESPATDNHAMLEVSPPAKHWSKLLMQIDGPKNTTAKPQTSPTLPLRPPASATPSGPANSMLCLPPNGQEPDWPEIHPNWPLPPPLQARELARAVQQVISGSKESRQPQLVPNLPVSERDEPHVEQQQAISSVPASATLRPICNEPVYQQPDLVRPQPVQQHETRLTMKPREHDPFANAFNSAKKQLNVDSPSFTPAQLPAGSKKSTFSSQTVNAAPFTPKGVATPTPQAISQDGDAPFLNPASVREFTPQTQNYDLNTGSTTNGMNTESSGGLYNAYSMAGINQALPTPQYNPYADEHNSMAGTSNQYYPSQGVYTAPVQPLQYHLYAPVGPHRSDLTPYQRQAHDFFISNELREDLQKKSAATLQVMPNSALPDVQPYHSLVPLEGPKSNQFSLFGSTVCWVYKATSKKNGHVYCLRRLQGARVSGKDSTNTPLNKWRRIANGSIVTPLEVFTSRDFNDTSLIFIHNYHPCSKTLAETHLSGRFRSSIAENLLWSYISQLCNALRIIHGGELAARCIHPTKIILTEKNRIRISACMILDVLEYDNPRPLADLQLDDLVDLGKLVLSLCLNQTHIHNVQASWQAFQQTNYSVDLKELVLWLITTPQGDAVEQKNIANLSTSIAHHLYDSFDASLHAYDDLTSALHKELENGRIARLLMKLGTINERPEHENDPNWSENGERYTLKLFRDYVFHQVDANNNAVLNLGHMLSCLNKLDAGIDEKVFLTSRDHQTAFVVSYKELKKQVTNAFQELQKGGQSKPATSRGVF